MADRFVYSTESGDLRGPREKKERSRAHQAKRAMPRDGIVRVQRESRGGKTVTVIYGLPCAGKELDAFAAMLKQKCGAGGTVKDGMVIIQGDNVDTVMLMIHDRGFPVKRAGG